MKIGFTDTQQGMTIVQKSAFRKGLEVFKSLSAVGNFYFHHGDCIGADSEAHDIALEFGASVFIYPPNIDTKRAFKQGADFVFQPKGYIARNHDIVDSCHLLIATPKEMNEQLRSGTWSTIRYARKTGKLLAIIYPNGVLA